MVKAVAKTVKVSPRKVNVVASLVRGRSVSDALTILEHTPRRAALPLSKVIKSAQANADNAGELNVKSLVIDRINVGPSIALKRYRPAAHGRALPYKRQTSNIEVVLTGEKKVKKAKKSAAKKTADADKKSTKENA